MSIQPQTSRSSARGFTIVELLVSIAIIVVIAALTLPAITQIVRSNNFATAVNNVTGTLGTARSIAIRRQTHAGVVFLWDAQREVMTLRIVELGSRQLGQLTADDFDPARTSAAVFWPATGIAPIELPRGTGVYGLAKGHSLPVFDPNINNPNDPDILGKIDNTTAHWYAGWRYRPTPGAPDEDRLTPWIFPMNDARMKLVQDPAEIGAGRIGADPFGASAIDEVGALDDDATGRALRHSQSFMVVFSPDGALTTGIRVGGKSVRWAFLEFPDEPRVIGANPERFGTPLLFDPEISVTPGQLPGAYSATEQAQARRTPNPEVLLAPVATIAVVDLRQMSEARNPAEPSGGQFPNDGRELVDPRPWMIMPTDAADWRLNAQSGSNWPSWVTNGPGGRSYLDDDRYAAKCRWIDRNGEIISFNRYTGQVLRSERQ